MPIPRQCKKVQQGFYKGSKKRTQVEVLSAHHHYSASTGKAKWSRGRLNAKPPWVITKGPPQVDIMIFI